MPKFKVEVPFAVFVSVEVEADDEDSAMEEAAQEVSIHGYCGNGGSDKLIGVSGSDESIYACDETLDGIDGFRITAELIED